MLLNNVKWHSSTLYMVRFLRMEFFIEMMCHQPRNLGFKFQLDQRNCLDTWRDYIYCNCILLWLHSNTLYDLSSDAKISGGLKNQIPLISIQRWYNSSKVHYVLKTVLPLKIFCLGQLRIEFAPMRTIWGVNCCFYWDEFAMLSVMIGGSLPSNTSLVNTLVLLHWPTLCRGPINATCYRNTITSTYSQCYYIQIWKQPG